MKLRLFFSELNIEAIQYDPNILIIYNGSINLSEKNVFSIHNFDFDREHYLNKFHLFLDSLKTNTKINEEIKRIIISNSEGFFNHILIELLKWVSLIELIAKENSITQIQFNEYLNSSYYIPFYESEGEINKGILYKKYDFIPYIISEIFKSKFDIKYNKKFSFIWLRIKIFLRRYVLLFINLIVQMINKFKISIKALKRRKIEASEYHKVFVSRGVAHTDFMFNYVKNETNNVTLLVGDGIFSFGKNISKVIKLGINNYIHEKELISYIDHLRSFFKILYLLIISRNNDFNVDLSTFQLNIKSAIREMIIFDFNVCLHKIAVLKYIKKIKNDHIHRPAIFTGEFYGGFAYTVGEIGRKFNIPSFQLQNFVCDHVKDVGFLNCESILFHSLSEQKKFIEVYNNLEHRLLFWGNIRLESISKEIIGQTDTLIKVIYFSQPILFEEEQFSIIQELLRLKDLGYINTIDIKIHPREKKEDYYYLANQGINIIDSSIVISNILNDYSVAIIQTSAVGQHIVLSGLPILICQVSPFSKSIKADFIVNDYYGNINDISQIEIKLKNLELLRNNFEKYRSAYIMQNKLTKSIDNFNFEYNKYIQTYNYK